MIVPDYQLSLAIGKEGQNARLAARLTGWRIDIRSDEAPAEPAIEPVCPWRRRCRHAVAERRRRTRADRPAPPVRLSARQPLDCTAVRHRYSKACADACPPAQSLEACAPAWGAGGGLPRPSCCASSPVTGVRASRSSPIRRDGRRAGERTCTPPPSASSWRCAAELSHGPSGSRDALATTAVEEHVGSGWRQPSSTDRDRPSRKWSSSS